MASKYFGNNPLVINDCWDHATEQLPNLGGLPQTFLSFSPLGMGIGVSEVPPVCHVGAGTKKLWLPGARPSHRTQLYARPLPIGIGQNKAQGLASSQWGGTVHSVYTEALAKSGGKEESRTSGTV